jgi:hypothetical protein
VNYTLANNGSYIFHHLDRKIITKNVYSNLDNETLKPELYRIVENPTEDELESHQCPFDGIEDIRIWPENQVIKFMGTSINFSNCGKNRMITGVYDSNLDYSDMIKCSVVDPPTDTGCEKNWTPVPRDNGAPTDFVYKWWPMKIGQLKITDPEIKNQTYLHIHTTYDLKSPIFKKLRGSTYFREYKADARYLVGLLHLSEKEWPRFYYHVLVLLDRDTLRPVRYTQPFSFTKRTTIEFCIGFLEQEGSYHFWISTYDRDAMKVSIDTSDLPFLFDVI